MLTAKTIDPKETADVFRKAREQAGSDEPALIGGVLDAVVNFTKVEEYTTFLAEYAIVDGNIVVHFFPPREAFELSAHNGQPRVTAEFLRRWKRTFPEVLSPVAEDYFQATQPIVQAKYIEEMTSWWLRAGGFGTSVLDPDAFILRFFSRMDAALDVVYARQAV